LQWQFSADEKTPPSVSESGVFLWFVFKKKRGESDEKFLTFSVAMVIL
jgi:hypothetical protein